MIPFSSNFYYLDQSRTNPTSRLSRLWCKVSLQGLVVRPELSLQDFWSKRWQLSNGRRSDFFFWPLRPFLPPLVPRRPTKRVEGEGSSSSLSTDRNWRSVLLPWNHLVDILRGMSNPYVRRPWITVDLWYFRLTDSDGSTTLPLHSVSMSRPWPGLQISRSPVLLWTHKGYTMYTCRPMSLDCSQRQTKSVQDRFLTRPYICPRIVFPWPSCNDLQILDSFIGRSFFYVRGHRSVDIHSLRVPSIPSPCPPLPGGPSVLFRRFLYPPSKFVHDSCLSSVRSSLVVTNALLKDRWNGKGIGDLTLKYP